jgi:hypothetical protein
MFRASFISRDETLKLSRRAGWLWGISSGMTTLPQIPERRSLSEYSLTELATILFRAATASDIDAVGTVARVISDRVRRRVIHPARKQREVPHADR